MPGGEAISWTTGHVLNKELCAFLGNYQNINYECQFPSSAFLYRKFLEAPHCLLMVLCSSTTFHSIFSQGVVYRLRTWTWESQDWRGPDFALFGLHDFRKRPSYLKPTFVIQKV